jgi:uncharacterized membrane protein
MSPRSRLIAIALLALILRVATLSKFSLGNDEIAEVTWSRLPYTEMMDAIKRDLVHPPLDYIVQFTLSKANAPEAARRLPSVIAGVSTVLAVFWLSSRWFGVVAAQWAALLLAISPAHIRYSQEVRPYACGLLFLVLTIAALEEFQRSEEKRFAWLWGICALAAAGWLYFAGLIAARVSAAILVCNPPFVRRQWRILALISFLTLAIYSPWLSVIRTAAVTRPPVPREEITRSWIAYRLQTLGTGDWQPDPVSAGSALFWIAASGGGVWALRNRRSAAAAVWFFGGVAAEIAILQLRPHYPAVRHLMPAWLGAFPLIGAFVANLRERSVVALAVPLLILFYDARTLRDYYNHGRPHWRSAVEYVREHRGSGEAVFLANKWTTRNFGYYWEERGAGRLPTVPSEGIINGPAWVVIAACPMTNENKAAVDALKMRRDYSFTNHLQLRFVEGGQTFRYSTPFCTSD